MAQEPTKTMFDVGLVELDEAEWQRRHDGPDWLTASMVPAILGYDEYRSPFTLFHELRSGMKSPPTEDQLFRWAVGRHMELLLGEFYTRRTGRPTFDPGPFAVAVYPDLPYLMASPDLITKNGSPGLVECKTAEVWTGDAQKWRDRTPSLRVQCQLQAQLACTGLQWGSLVGMVGLGKFFHVDCERNDGFIEAMLDCIAEFKERLETNDPPPVDGMSSTRETLGKLFPEDDGTTTELDYDVAQGRWELMRECKAESDKWSTSAEEHRNWLVNAIGDARTGMAGENKFTLATIQRSPKATVNLEGLDRDSRARVEKVLDNLGVLWTLTEPKPYRQLYPPKKWK